MKCRDEMRVKLLAKETLYRGRTGTVVADSAPGELVEVEFHDELITHHFLAEDIEPIN